MTSSRTDVALGRFTPDKDWKLLWLPALSGVLGFLSFPKPAFGYVAWVALVPLIVFIGRARSTALAFLGGLFFGYVQFFALLVWIPAVLIRYGSLHVLVAWALYALMIFSLACHPALACAITRSCAERGGERLLLILPVTWVATEYLRNFSLFGGFPWLQSGYSQTESLTLIQVSDLTGVYGVSFMVVWTNAALAWAGPKRFRALHGRPDASSSGALGNQHGTRTALLPLLLAAITILAGLLYGHRAMVRWQAVEADHAAALFQGNIPADEPESVLARRFRDGYLEMANRLGSAGLDLLVLPESPSPAAFQYDFSYRESLLMLARRFSLGMIFNNIGLEEHNGRWEYFNSAFFVRRDGVELGRYDKIHLVPFGEYLPWKKVFFFAETITKDVSDFTPGSEHRTFLMGEHRLNAIICFEAIFPELVGEFVRRGSRLIVNLTNDGWYGDTPAAHQHLSMARWRAIENRRYILRAANSGVSAVIEPTGRIQRSTSLMRREVCVGRFAFLAEQTFYTRRGDVFAITCAIITCLVWAFYVPFRRPRRSETEAKGGKDARAVA